MPSQEAGLAHGLVVRHQAPQLRPVLLVGSPGLCHPFQQLHPQHLAEVSDSAHLGLGVSAPDHLGLGASDRARHLVPGDQRVTEGGRKAGMLRANAGEVAQTNLRRRRSSQTFSQTLLRAIF